LISLCYVVRKTSSSVEVVKKVDTAIGLESALNVAARVKIVVA